MWTTSSRVSYHFLADLKWSLRIRFTLTERNAFANIRRAIFGVNNHFRVLFTATYWLRFLHTFRPHNFRHTLVASTAFISLWWNGHLFEAQLADDFLFARTHFVLALNRTAGRAFAFGAIIAVPLVAHVMAIKVARLALLLGHTFTRAIHAFAILAEASFDRFRARAHLFVNERSAHIQ